jgi:hypothetical protein
MLKKWFCREANIIRMVISVVALVLLSFHAFSQNTNIDKITVSLLFAAILPWISSFLSDASLPGGWKFSFREMEQTVENQDKKLKEQEVILNEQRKIIDDLVIFSMAWFLFDLLKGLFYAHKNGTEYLFYKNEINTDNLLFLRNNGYIEIHGIRQLEHNADLTKVVKLTPIGNAYVEIREIRDLERTKHNQKLNTDSLKDRTDVTGAHGHGHCLE